MSHNAIILCVGMGVIQLELAIFAWDVFKELRRTSTELEALTKLYRDDVIANPSRYKLDQKEEE